MYITYEFRIILGDRNICYLDIQVMLHVHYISTSHTCLCNIIPISVNRNGYKSNHNYANNTADNKKSGNNRKKQREQQQQQ